MFTAFSRPLACAAIAFAGVASAGSAIAQDTIVRSFIMPRIGISFDYGFFGYTAPDGSYVNLAGQQILSSRVEIDFTPAAGVDVSSLVMAMVVPVTGSVSQYFAITGDMLVETTPGTWHYEATSNDYNGTIYSGRFSFESYGLNALGDPVSMAGTLSATSGFHYTVSSPVPEPASWALFGAGLAALVARRRFKAA